MRTGLAISNRARGARLVTGLDNPRSVTKVPATGLRNGPRPGLANKKGFQTMKRESNEYLHFFEQSQDLLCIAGLDGYFKRLNPAWTSVLGHSMRELLATPFLELVHPDDLAATMAEMENIRGGKPVIWFENRYRCHDGSYRRLLWRADPVMRRKLIYAIARDVTGRHDALEQSLGLGAWQRAILDGADLTFISTRPDGIIQTINASALRKLGYTESEVVGRLTPEVIHDPEEVRRRAAVLSAELGRAIEPGFEAFVAKARLGVPDENEWTYIRRDGSRFPVLLSVTPLRREDGEITGFLGVGRDVSAQKKAEQKRAEAENLTRAILDNTPAVMFVKDAQGRYEMVNRQFESLFHVTVNQVIGHTDMDIFPAAMAAAFQRNDRFVLDSGRPLQVEEVAPHDDGPHTYLSVKFPIMSPAGEPLLICGVATDITERKAMEREAASREARLRAVLETAVEGIVTINERGVILTANRAATVMFGYAPGEMIGQNVIMLMPEPTRSEHDGYLKRYLATGERRIIGQPREVEAVRKDGALLPIILSVGECVVGGERIFTGIMHDNTERHRAERELQRSNRDLEQFAYVASHDLQEPLRMVTSYLQLLEKRCSALLDEDAKTFLNTALDGAKRMRDLIQDLLAYSRVGSRGRPFAPVSMSRVLEDTTVNLKTAIESSGAAITSDLLPEVLGDAVQMGQLLQNLIGNAIKFSGGKAPKIHVGAIRSGATWRFAVADNGIGIDPKFFERIFVIFQRLHTRSEYEGTGIGLAVCKRIVERHNGRIWPDSAPGKGTTFFFTLPAVDMPSGF